MAIVSLQSHVIPALTKRLLHIAALSALFQRSCFKVQHFGVISALISAFWEVLELTEKVGCKSFGSTRYALNKAAHELGEKRVQVSLCDSSSWNIFYLVDLDETIVYHWKIDSVNVYNLSKALKRRCAGRRPGRGGRPSGTIEGY